MDVLIPKMRHVGLILAIAGLLCLPANGNTLRTNLEMLAALWSMFARDASHTDPMALLPSEPRDSRGYYVRGKFALRTGDADLAIRWLEPAVEMQPDAALPRFALGEAYLDVSGDTAAVQQFRQARDADRYFLGLGRTKASERYLRLAIAMNPESCDAYYALADVLSNAWRIDEAVAIYKEGVSYGSNNSAQMHLAQARIREADGDWEGAIQSYLQAAVLEPRNPDAY